MIIPIRKAYLFFVFPLLLLGCQDDNPASLLLADSLYQHFEIRCDRDTVLESRSGVLLHIAANTFDCSADKTVKIQLAAIHNKADMVLNQMYTITTEGALLESGGMFQIKDLTNNTERFNHPIQLDIPTPTANPKMQQYAMKEVDGQVTWAAPQDNIELKNIDGLQNGEDLFLELCTSCHNTNLRDDMTGPALGNVHLFRDMDWLRAFTRNSMEVIDAGDTLANCLFQQWGSVMTAFPMLSDEDINNIFEYIANESRLQEIRKNEVEYLTSCELIDLDSIAKANENSLSDAINTFDSTVSINTNYIYSLKIKKSNWVNADFLASSKNQIEPIIVEFADTYKNLAVSLVFKDKNIAISFLPNHLQQWRLWHPSKSEEGKINFPLGETVYIVAYTQSQNPRYKIMEYQPTATDNQLTLELEEGSKEAFVAALKKL